MINILWVLVPVAVVIGWFTTRRRGRRAPERVTTSTPSPEYFEGLNYLLNEQPDKAIEVFVRMLEVDSGTVEIHFALGNLFRRRGEVDRAIRIHQNLIARPTLNADERNQALLELGEDYMRAGLFDRAESLFKELVGLNAYTDRALRHLLDIYQQEKEWDAAIDVARRLEAQSGAQMGPMIAHYHCEQAEQARKRGSTGEAMRLLKRALAADRNCARASILQGEIEMELDNYKAALRAYRRVEQQDIDYLPEIMTPVERCYVQMGRPAALIEHLEEVLKRYDGIAPVLALADLRWQQQGEDAAAAFLAEQLERRPSLEGMERLIAVNLSRGGSEACLGLETLRGLAQRLTAGRPTYRCHHCGFTGKTMHWQCPSCRHWATVKPMKHLEIK